jgi:HSP20 family molecular chaperone IbpA
MYRSLFPRDLFAELRPPAARPRRPVRQLAQQIRGLGRGGYPALNVGITPTSVEIFAFAPGMDPAKIEVNLDRGVLTIDGERRPPCRPATSKTTVHTERTLRRPLPPRRQPARRHRPERGERRLPRRRAAHQRQAPRSGAAAPHRRAVNPDEPRRPR